MLNPVADMDMETRLLIVDDDPGIRELTAGFLATHGYVVDTAADGTEMRRLLAAENYSLSVLDVMMPARAPCQASGRTCASPGGGSIRSGGS